MLRFSFVSTAYREFTGVPLSTPIHTLQLRDAQREAILEFPMPSARRSKLQPQLRRPQVNPRIVENGIRAAFAAGWEPISRGKPVSLEVDSNGC